MLVADEFSSKQASEIQQGAELRRHPSNRGIGAGGSARASGRIGDAARIGTKTQKYTKKDRLHSQMSTLNRIACSWGWAFAQVIIVLYVAVLSGQYGLRRPTDIILTTIITIPIMAFIGFIVGFAVCRTVQMFYLDIGEKIASYIRFPNFLYVLLLVAFVSQLATRAVVYDFANSAQEQRSNTSPLTATTAVPYYSRPGDLRHFWTSNQGDRFFIDLRYMSSVASEFRGGENFLALVVMFKSDPNQNFELNWVELDCFNMLYKYSSFAPNSEWSRWHRLSQVSFGEELANTVCRR